jgi:hypothetical protein
MWVYAKKKFWQVLLNYVEIGRISDAKCYGKNCPPVWGYARMVVSMTSKVAPYI